MPYYLPQGDYLALINPSIRVKDGFFSGAMSPGLRKKYGEVCIPFAERWVGKSLKEVTNLPRYEARFFQGEFIIEQKPTSAHLDPNKAFSIDPGLDKVATGVDTSGASFAEYIINYCLRRQLGKLIIGCILGCKQEINLSKRIAIVRQLYSQKVTTIWISKEWLGGF